MHVWTIGVHDTPMSAALGDGMTFASGVPMSSLGASILGQLGDSRHERVRTAPDRSSSVKGPTTSPLVDHR